MSPISSISQQYNSTKQDKLKYILKKNSDQFGIVHIKENNFYHTLSSYF